MLREEGSRHHPHPVMHKTRRIQFPHPRIHQRVTGPPHTPTHEFLLVIPPFDSVIGRLERPPLSYRRKMPKDHLKEIPPDQLVKINSAFYKGPPCQPPDAHRPKP